MKSKVSTKKYQSVDLNKKKKRKQCRGIFGKHVSFLVGLFKAVIRAKDDQFKLKRFD